MHPNGRREADELPRRLLRGACWLAASLWLGCGPGSPSETPAVTASAAAEPPPAASGAADPPPPTELDWPPGELRKGGGPVAGKLGPEERHHYRLPLEGGQCLRLQVEQHGVDLLVRLRGPGGSLLLEADRPIDDRGSELVLAVAAISGVHTLEVEAWPGSGPGRYEARIESLRPATERDRELAATYRRFRQAESLDPEGAAAAWAETLVAWHRLEEVALEGEVLARIARHHHESGEREAAVEHALAAAASFARAGDRRWEALVRGEAASNLERLARYDEMAEQYRLAAGLASAAGDRLLAAKTHYGLGVAFRKLGEVQKSLDQYEAALELWPEEERVLRPHVLHGLGVLHHLYFQDPDRSRRLLGEALELWDPADPSYERYRGRTLNQLGCVALDSGNAAEARARLAEALALPRGDDACGRANTLARLALAADAEGGRAEADRHLAEALNLVAGGACPGDRTPVLLRAAELAEGRGDAASAAARYEEVGGLCAALGDRTGQAESLAGMARAERRLGNLPAALDASRRALAILEGVRPTVLREDLRTSYFATGQEVLDLHVALLLETGAPEAAWEAAERGRARALRDLLVEAGAGVRGAADAALADRERNLQRRLNVLERQRLRAVGSHPEAETLLLEVEALVEELETVRGEVRRRSPAYAAVTAPEPLSLDAVQRELLDDDTLLLEYRLGEEASWLWAVSRDSFRAFTLPPRGDIEAAAREATAWARSLQWPGRSPPPLCRLSRLLLGPVAAELGERRLVVVPDGALEAVPFAALPDPAAPGACAEAPPLVARHEIVLLPSVGALAAQRRSLAGRPPGPGWLAVVADPAYATGGDRPAPLPHAGEEAAAILAGLPRERTLSATGPEASKERVLGGSLAGYRIVHFATHGVLNADHPLLSHLALADRGAGGSPGDGALYAHEIYDLDLPAELVVLSACDTALGRQVRGEGLVSGLPRAFLYAGAERVLVSLWPVPDRGTRELMEHFYRGIFVAGLPPGRALQEAQRSLRDAGRLPYQWAGFVLQGDWRPLAPFSDSP